MAVAAPAVRVENSSSSSSSSSRGSGGAGGAAPSYEAKAHVKHAQSGRPAQSFTRGFQFWIGWMVRTGETVSACMRACIIYEAINNNNNNDKGMKPRGETACALLFPSLLSASRCSHCIHCALCVSCFFAQSLRLTDTARPVRCIQSPPPPPSCRQAGTHVSFKRPLRAAVPVAAGAAASSASASSSPSSVSASEGPLKTAGGSGMVLGSGERWKDDQAKFL